MVIVARVIAKGKKKKNKNIHGKSNNNKHGNNINNTKVFIKPYLLHPIPQDALTLLATSRSSQLPGAWLNKSRASALFKQSEAV